MAWIHNGRKYWYHNGKRYSCKLKKKKIYSSKKINSLKRTYSWIDGEGKKRYTDYKGYMNYKYADKSYKIKDEIDNMDWLNSIEDTNKREEIRKSIEFATYT